MSKWLSSKRAIAPADLVKATLESISTLVRFHSVCFVVFALECCNILFVLNWVHFSKTKKNKKKKTTKTKKILFLI